MSVTIEEVLPGIFTASHRVVEGKNGVVFGTGRALAIDTGSDLLEGRAVADVIRAHGAAPDWVAFTHGHGDHAGGVGAFRGAEVYAHSQTEAVIRAQIPRWARRDGIPKAEVEAALAWPTVTFDSMLRVHLGGRHVRLIHTSGHSPDSCCAYVEECNVLFGGDTVVTAIVPVCWWG